MQKPWQNLDGNIALLSHLPIALVHAVTVVKFKWETRLHVDVIPCWSEDKILVCSRQFSDRIWWRFCDEIVNQNCGPNANFVKIWLCTHFVPSFWSVGGLKTNFGLESNLALETIGIPRLTTWFGGWRKYTLEGFKTFLVLVIWGLETCPPTFLLFSGLDFHPCLAFCALSPLVYFALLSCPFYFHFTL